MYLGGTTSATRSDASDRIRSLRSCYEIFVRSFYDSDGVGDLNGLIQKLDYINDGDVDSQRLA